MAVWTPHVFSFGAVLTSPQMNQVQANFTALAEGAAGAPSILAAAIGTGEVGQSEIAANAVGQSELKDALSEVSSGVTANITLPGGTYGFYPQTRHNGGGGGSNTSQIAVANAATSYATNIHMLPAGGAIFAQQRFFSASRPYWFDKEDGEVQQFVFAELDANGSVVSAYVSTEAPWHYNGPTDIRGKLLRVGKQFEWGQMRRDMSEVTDSYEAALASGDVVRVRAYLEAFAGAGATFREVDQDLKNADMILIPQPFADKDPAVDRIVILDPVSALCEQIAEMNQHDRVSICELLHDGYLKFDSAVIANRAGPPGVAIHALKWRNTGE